MRMKGVFALLCMTLTCGAQKKKQETSTCDSKAGNIRGKTCSNLTQVLDNWKFAIVTQVKDLLVNDHASVLPEYHRIRPLSGALEDLYKQFNALKDELGRLTSKFDDMEAFADDLKEGRFTLPQRPMQRIPPTIGLRSPLGAQKRVTHSPSIKRSPWSRTRRGRPPRP